MTWNKHTTLWQVFTTPRGRVWAVYYHNPADRRMICLSANREWYWEDYHLGKTIISAW